MRSVRIPQDRVGAVIGTKGKTKRMLQKMSGVKMDIDNEEGIIMIHDDDAKDAVMALKLMDVVKAIARGVNPEKALRLFQDDEFLEIIDIKEFAGGRSNQLERMRGRLIGTDGRTRSLIEELTGVYMCVYGNTITLIGSSVNLPVAKHAIELILNGSEHSTVYRYLEGQRPRLRICEMGFDI